MISFPWEGNEIRLPSLEGIYFPLPSWEGLGVG